MDPKQRMSLKFLLAEDPYLIVGGQPSEEELARHSTVAALEIPDNYYEDTPSKVCNEWRESPEFERQDEAARTIQQAYREHRNARRQNFTEKIAEMKHQIRDVLRRRKAAVLILHVWRGYKAVRAFRKFKQAVSTIQAQIRLRNLPANANKEEKAAIILQRFARKRLAQKQIAHLRQQRLKRTRELEEERTRILTDPGDAMKAYSDYDSMIHFRGITDKVELHMRVTIQECQRLAQLKIGNVQEHLKVATNTENRLRQLQAIKLEKDNLVSKFNTQREINKTAHKNALKPLSPEEIQRRQQRYEPLVELTGLAKHKKLRWADSMGASLTSELTIHSVKSSDSGLATSGSAPNTPSKSCFRGGSYVIADEEAMIFG